MKQTAIEWLEKELKERYPLINSEPLFEKAKNMEKGQIIESYCQGCFDMWKDDGIVPRETSEQYYNETYKNGNK